jgi:hypothetical protein
MEEIVSDEIKTAEDMERALLWVFETGSTEDGSGLDSVTRSESFESALLMTTDRGLVIRMANGAEFQLTIVRTKAPVKVAVGE